LAFHKQNNVLAHRADSFSDIEVRYVSSLGRQEWAKDYMIFVRCIVRFFTDEGTEEHSRNYVGRKGQNSGTAHLLPFPASLSIAHAAGESPAAVPCGCVPRGSTTILPSTGLS